MQADVMGDVKHYGEDVEEYILARLAKGDTLRAICREPCPRCVEGAKTRPRICNHLPDEAVVRLWAIGDRPDFAPRYARAREAGIHSWVDEVVEIADDSRNDWMEKLDKEGQCVGVVLNKEHVQRSRLRIDTRLWVAARVVKAMYGGSTVPQNPDGSTPIADPNPDV